MASIQFSADLDTSKLDQSMKQSRQTVGDWVKSVESGAGIADKAFQKSGDQLKQAITSQKQLIKDIENDLKHLQEVQAGATGKKLSDANLDVRGAKKALAEEQAVLNGLQKEQIALNSVEKESQSGLIGSLGKWAMGLLTVAAAMKVGKAIIEATETTAHKFEQVTTAAASATGFFFKTIASGDWSNFQNGMDTAVKGAIAYVDAMENVHRLTNQEKTTSADIDLEIAKLREQTWDRSTKNAKVREQALSKIVELTDKKNKPKADNAQVAYDAELEKASTDTGGKLKKDEIFRLINKYDSIKEVKEIGDKYNSLIAQKTGSNANTSSAGADIFKLTGSYSEETKKKIDELGPKAAEMGKEAAKWSLATFETMDRVASSYEHLRQAQATLAVGSKFDQRQLATAKNQVEDDAAAAAKKAQDEKNNRSKEQIDYDSALGRQRIDNQLAIEQELLNSQKDGSEKERAQADLDYRKSINEIAKQKADQLEARNKQLGAYDEAGKPIKGKYTDKLLPEDQKQIDDKIAAEEKIKAAKIVAINEKEKEDLIKIQDEVYNYRLTGIQKEKEAVKDKYDKMLAIAKKAGDTQLQDDISAARGRANTEIDNKYALNELDFQEQVDNRKATLSITNEEELQKKLFEIWVAAQQKKIDLLKLSSDPKDQQDAQIMQLDLAVANKTEGLARQEKLQKNILDSANQLVNAIGQFNSGLAQSLGLALNLGNTISKAFNPNKGDVKLNQAEIASSIVSGATGLISMVAGQTADNKKVMADYYASIISQQQQYNLLLNDQIRLGDVVGSVWYTDYGKQLANGANALQDANKNLAQGMANFNSNEAIVGKKNVINGNNVLGGVASGAALGAGIGSIVPGIGTAIGAVVGGLVGALTGLFAKKKKDVVAPLLSTYPDLIKANGEFNADLAKTLIANNKVTDATKQTLQNLIDWTAQAEEARKEIVGVIDTIVGSVGNDLRTALVTAFEDGTDAAKVMGDTVGKVVEDLVSNLVFAATIGPLLDKLKVDMYASEGLGPDGKTPLVPIDPKIADGSFIDDLGRFFASLPGAQAKFNAGMTVAAQQGGAAGFNNLFSPTLGNAASTMTGAVRRELTEATGGELAGLFRKFSDDGRQTRDNTKMAVDHLVGIEKNTLDTVAELQKVNMALIESNANTAKTAKNTGPVNLRGF